MGLMGDLMPLILLGGGIYLVYMYQQQQGQQQTCPDGSVIAAGGTCPAAAPAPVTYTTPTNQIQCSDGTLVATAAECPKSNAECANFKDSGEDEDEECTNECGKSGNAEDCNACEKACDKPYVHRYSTNDTQRCHNLAGDWDDVNECCSKGNTAGSGLRVCPEDDEEDVPAPVVSKQSGPRINSRFPGGARPVARKVPVSPCAKLTGETRRKCLGLPPTQQASKKPVTAVHGAAKCAKLTGVTRCACLGIPMAKCNPATGQARYTHSYYGAPTYNPSTYFSITVA